MSDVEFDPNAALPRPTLPEDEPKVLEEALEAGEIRRRAAGGAVLVALRGAGLQVVGFLANIILARLLAPSAFGLVALGNTIIVFGDLMANSGASQTLIRSPTTPTVEDLRSVMAFQMALTVVLTVAVAIVAIPIGSAGALAAVMCLSLPLLALRTPPTVLLERALAYRSLVAVEITENVVYYVWAIVTVAVFGFGVWGLATGVVIRVLSGTAFLVVVGPVKVLRPRWSWSHLRPVLGFGLKLQITSALNFIRDQVLNISLAALSGTTTLGLWTLAVRAWGIPLILFQALWRVSYPAITRLMALGEDTRELVERSTGIVATAGSAPLCALGGSAPALIPAVFGARWAKAAAPMPPVCLGLMIVGPVSVAAAGFLAAHGDAGTILRGAFWHTLAQFAVGLPLLPVIGLTGIGVGAFTACVVEAVVMGRKATSLTGARQVAPIVRPIVAGVISGGGAWLLSRHMGPTFPAALAAGAVALVGYAMILALIPGNLLRPTLQAMRRAIGAAT